MANPCPTCLPLDCFSAADTDLYSIQQEIFPFVFSCPAGYSCGGADSFNMVCCGQLLSTQFPPNATVDDKQALIQVVVNQCDVRLIYCGDNPTTPTTTLFYNRSKKCTVLCPDGTVFTFFVAAGTFAATTQDQADSDAANYACQQAGLKRVCLGSIHVNACAGTAYSASISHSGGIPPFVFSLVSGALPSGLSLSASGVISGTPTTVQDATFTVECLTGTSGAFVVKEYEIKVTACTPIVLSVAPTSWNPGDTINYVGVGPSFPGDLFQIDFTGTDWDGRGTAITGHFNDVGGQFDGSGNATMVSLRMMRRIFTSSISGRQYWGAGPCTARIEDTDQSPSVFSNTLNRTLTRHATIHIDATVLAYIIAHPDTNNPNIPTGALTQEFFNENGAGNVVQSQYEDTSQPIGGSIFAPTSSQILGVTGADLDLDYNIGDGVGGRVSLTYRKLASSINSPAGVYNLLNDPLGTAPATCTTT